MDKESPRSLCRIETRIVRTDSQALQNGQTMTKAVKEHGRVYTPVHIVKNILDFGGYLSGNILKRHVIDNSCGDGAFLKEIVKRYCDEYLKYDRNAVSLKTELETFIHGIELDCVEWRKCLDNLNDIVSTFGINDVRWDILNQDTLCTDTFNGKMDYVFGNPPYVRVHNLQENYELVKKYRFAAKGMTDLFIVFFEIGFNMLSSSGRMCLITPISWLTSKAGQFLRKFIVDKNNLSGLVDLGHYQPFDSTTYTIISRFDASGSDNVDYCRYDECYLVPKHEENLSVGQIYVSDNFYFSDHNSLEIIKKIKASESSKYVTVKNGFATLSDKVFIGDFDFEEGTIEILKASTGKWLRCIYPYDVDGRPIPLERFRKNERAYQHLSAHKADLTYNRDIECDSGWYLFGRTQAIKDVCLNKYAINTIIKDVSSIKLEKVHGGKGVYSGLYIITDIPFEIIREIVVSQQFVDYIKLLKNYKSGGYYAFSSKDLEQFVNFKISEKYGQSWIS